MPSYTSRKTKLGTVVDVRFRIISNEGLEVQRRLCGYPNKRTAEKAYLDFMKNYSPPAIKIQRADSYVFGDLFRLYKKKKETELAVSSFYDLNWISDKFILPFFENKSIPSLKKADYVAWQTDLWASINPSTQKPYAQKYLSKIRGILYSFLDWAEEVYDIINLLKIVKKPRRREKKKEMQIWELSQFVHFQNTTQDCLWKTFFMLLFYSGCRIGELVALQNNDVMKNENTYSITINKGLTRKTNSTSSYIIDVPKTSSSNRTIMLPNVITSQLDSYFQWKKDNNIPSTFLFGGEAPIAQRTYQRAFSKYTDLAELPHIRIHDLRHSHASLLIHLNVPITVISKRLGHSSVKMTLDKYAHCYPDSDADATSAIDSVYPL